jgi:RND family efflux transporter MFP subunit
VPGLISDVFVHDNERVSKGQQLFRIDQRRFQYALDQATADVASDQADLDQAKRDLVRSKTLTSIAITQQQVEKSQQAVDVAQAKLDAAKAALDVARLNLERSTVVAPVNGIVTNFDLLPGRYVNVGAPVFALLDSDSFRVEGYFEETKLRRIRIGEDATVKLIGDPRVLSGHVASVAYGIEDQNRSTSSELLASVNPTFNWVRLAQRIPVRIKLDDVPADLLLVAGRTATVSVGKIRWW